MTGKDISYDEINRMVDASKLGIDDAVRASTGVDVPHRTFIDPRDQTVYDTARRLKRELLEFRRKPK